MSTGKQDTMNGDALFHSRTSAGGGSGSGSGGYGGRLPRDGAQLALVALAVGLGPLGVGVPVLVGQAAPGLAHRRPEVLTQASRQASERSVCDESSPSSYNSK